MQKNVNIWQSIHKRVEASQLNLQLINSFRTFNHSREVIFLQDLLIFRLEKCETSTGLGKNEQAHFESRVLVLVMVLVVLRDFFVELKKKVRRNFLKVEAA